jgi:hypothetical protein
MSPHSVNIRICLDIAGLLISKCSATVFRFSGCPAIRPMISLRTGSAIAWKTSLLMLVNLMGNHSVTNIKETVWLHKFLYFFYKFSFCSVRSAVAVKKNYKDKIFIPDILIEDSNHFCNIFFNAVRYAGLSLIPLCPCPFKVISVSFVFNNSFSLIEAL